ncbi:MAG: hypothetical protein C6I00_05985 [Nitratiruptor sp.]|nr:hypothetical protein [Nitratiruptor sp.]
MLPEVEGEDRIVIHGYYAPLEGDRSCNLYRIRVTLIGTQDDGEGEDLVDFTIYDDGRVVAQKYVAIPVGARKEVELLLFYEAPLSQRAPGVAIESQELGIYVDPFTPEENGSMCLGYRNELLIRSHIQRNCRTMSRYGSKCR